MMWKTIKMSWPSKNKKPSTFGVYWKILFERVNLWYNDKEGRVNQGIRKYRENATKEKHRFTCINEFLGEQNSSGSNESTTLKNDV